jgi:uncharacterized protein (DUF169 family)
MLLTEASKAADLDSDVMSMGRPTCAMIPAAMQSEHSVSSLGCIGNRIYTGLGDNELYFTIPGQKVSAVVEKLETIVDANRQLDTFHRQHAAAVAAGK